MRLERLHIGGFGRLADVDLDLDQRVTVLLGQNESGKSTVHRALRAALFGIDAGGPGRPTDRSEWARWSPWSSSPYAMALTYRLSDGRRIRVARRLEQREQSCQVQEIGGADITDSLRVGRAVLPGQVHLGIDEGVFCASACVGDDGLRLGAADSPAARAAQVQEAIERLADSGSATTAAEALLALDQAARRVGSERRTQSPLGRAANRLRQLDVEIEEARGRVGRLAAEEQRLRSLEAEAAAAESRRADAERRWLLGRLAALAAQRAELETSAAEMVHLAAEIEGNAHLAGFPAEMEDRVIVLGAEVQEARRSSDEAAARAQGAATPLAEVRRRRAEIAAGVAALGDPADVGQADLAAFHQLREDLAEALAGRRHQHEMTAAVARRDALRREIAATGLTAIPPASVGTALELLERARGGGRRRSAHRLGAALVGAAALATAIAAAVGRPTLAVAAGGLAAATAVLSLLAGSLLGRERESARRALASFCPGTALDAEGLARVGERLPRLRALHQELYHEEVRIETLGAGARSTATRMGELAARAEALAVAAGVRVQRMTGATPDAAEMRVRAVLAAVDGAAGIHGRRLELQTEDLLLRQREADLERVAAEADQRAEAAGALEARLRRILDRAGIDAVPIPAAVAAFRAACAGRARHAEASRRLDELRRRAHLAGDPASLERRRHQLEEQLTARGGDVGQVETALPLSQAQLQELETEAEHARQSHVVAVTAAASLGARLCEMRAGQPALADLEDERSACLAARDRGRHQLEALRRAAELIDEATRGVHRDLAPRLAESVAQRLALLTEGRYSAVNVDTAHFGVSLLGGDRPDLVPLELVSHGTRDQVSLLLRLALAEVLSGGAEPVPLLLDEPLLSADPQRRATALRFLWALSASNQVVLSTSDPAVAEALQGCGEESEVRVIEMSGPGATLETVGRPVAMVRAL